MNIKYLDLSAHSVVVIEGLFYKKYEQLKLQLKSDEEQIKLENKGEKI